MEKHLLAPEATSIFGAMMLERVKIARVKEIIVG
jgi:hypothetical protein